MARAAPDRARAGRAFKATGGYRWDVEWLRSRIAGMAGRERAEAILNGLAHLKSSFSHPTPARYAAWAFGFDRRAVERDLFYRALGARPRPRRTVWPARTPRWA